VRSVAQKGGEENPLEVHQGRMQGVGSPRVQPPRQSAVVCLLSRGTVRRVEIVASFVQEVCRKEGVFAVRGRRSATASSLQRVVYGALARAPFMPRAVSGC